MKPNTAISSTKSWVPSNASGAIVSITIARIPKASHVPERSFQWRAPQDHLSIKASCAFTIVRSNCLNTPNRSWSFTQHPEAYPGNSGGGEHSTSLSGAKVQSGCRLNGGANDRQFACERTHLAMMHLALPTPTARQALSGCTARPSMWGFVISLGAGYRVHNALAQTTDTKSATIYPYYIVNKS